MNEKQVIKKIQLLKTIQPTQTVLDDIKKFVYQQVQIENENPNTIGLLKRIYSLFASSLFVSYCITSAILLIFFISIYSIFQPNQFHTMVLHAKLAIAPNQYYRASISFSDTKHELANNATENMLQSLALTNTELGKLQLKGEKGKYTMQQCHALYQQYLAYLEKENSMLTQKNKPSHSVLESQINSYEESAEKKLHMYSSL